MKPSRVLCTTCQTLACREKLCDAASMVMVDGPWLPGQSFEYASACPLRTPRGTMRGQGPDPIYTPYTPPIHPLYTPYTPPIHPLYTPYSPPIHPLSTSYPPPVPPLYTSYTPPIHLLSTPYPPPIYPQYTPPGPGRPTALDLCTDIGQTAPTVHRYR